MRIPSKYFYYKEGSRIFEEIMALEEYYPTKCELEIFETYKSDILNGIGDEHFNLVDIGAGNGAKNKTAGRENELWILNKGVFAIFSLNDFSTNI